MSISLGVVIGRRSFLLAIHPFYWRLSLDLHDDAALQIGPIRLAVS